MAAELHLQPPLLGNPISNPAAAPPSATDTLGPKRHRRPSVRLGDIGDQPATVRTSKPNTASTKSSKIRPLTNLVTSSNNGADLDYNYGGFSYSHQSKKSRRTTFTTKRVRTNFKLDHDHGHGDDHDQELFEDRENGGDNIHEFDADDNHNTNTNNPQDIDIDGPDEEHQSPIQSDDDDDDDTMWQRRSNRRRGNLGFGLDDGVRNWLMELGLARYAPLFEIHEVDFQVLPFLTLEDLKDMGIHAVGSRRKFYSAIVNLRKN